jgi:hypothetical protein
MSFFTVVFYGVKIFCCKTAQLSVTQRECGMAKTPNVSNCVQHCENRRAISKSREHNSVKQKAATLMEA